jgi:hypothetical protein
MALAVKKKYPVPHKTRPHHTLPQRTLKREQRKKSAHRLMSTVLTLAVIAIGAGLVYTWYNGQQLSATADQPVAVRTSRPVIKPPKIASDAKVGVAVQSYTTDAKPGQNASIAVRTNPEAECAITMKYNNVAAVDSGLVTKLADEFGVASWSWTVGASTPAGKWPIEVTCKNKKHSAVVIADIVITK